MVAANLTSNKLPEHGASLTVDVSGCTCQVRSDCLIQAPAPRRYESRIPPVIALLWLVTDRLGTYRPPTLGSQ